MGDRVRALIPDPINAIKVEDTFERSVQVERERGKTRNVSVLIATTVTSICRAMQLCGVCVR